MAIEETLNVRLTHTNEDTSVKSIYYPETTVDQVHGLNNTITSINNNFTTVNNNINSHATSIRSNYDSIRALNNKDSILTTAYNNASLAVESLKAMSEVASKTIAIPEQSGVLIYNHGATMKPSWNNYDSKKESITGGTTVHSLAGSYNVQFTTSKYYYPNGQKTVTVGWDIDKYTLAEPILQNNSFEYNTSLQSIAFSSSTVGYSIRGTTSNTSVGSYKVSIKPVNKNYQWINGSSTEIKVIDWSIVSKGGLKLPYQSTTYTYDTTKKNIKTDNVLTNYESDKMSIGGVFEQSLASIYTAKVAIKDTLSYKWEDGSSSVKTFQWSINNAELNPNSVQLKDEDYEYNTAGITLTSKDFNGFDANKMSIAGGNKATAIGSHKISIDAKPNYVWMSGSSSLKSNVFTWYIIESKLTEYPYLKQTLYTYNNVNYTPTLNNTYGVSVSGDVTKSLASSYKIYVKPTGNNSWPDGTKIVQTLTWAIQPKSINLPTQGTVPAYSGNTHSIVSYLNNYNNSEISIGGTTTAKSASVYSATLKLKSVTNLRWLKTNDIDNKTMEWTIKNAAIAPPTLKITTFEYKANTAHTIGFSNTSTVGFSILAGSETVGTNVKVYKMSVAPAKNYEWNTSKNKDKIYPFTWEIKSNSVFAIPVQKSVPPYSSNEININDTKYWTGYDTTNISMGGTTKGTNANSYNAIFKIKDSNFTWSDNTKTNKTVSWSIGKKTISPTITKAFFPWTVNATVKPTINDSVGTTLTGTTSSKDRGYFTITAAPTANYAFEKNATSKKFTWTLASVLANPGFNKGVVNYQYNPNGTKVSLASSVGVAIAGSLQATALGSYNVTVTPNTLFAWSDGTRTAKPLTWNIVKRSIATNLSLSKTSTIYSGGQQTVSVVGAVTGQHSIGGSIKATTAKTYTVSIKPINTNYVWSGTTNSTSIKTLTWTIKPQSLTAPTIDASKVPTYQNNTNDQTSLVSVLNANYNSTKMSLSGTTTLKVPTVATAKVALTDIINYNWSDGTTADKEIKWSIKTATIPANVTIKTTRMYNENAPSVRVHDLLTPTISQKLIYTDDVNDYVYKTVAGAFSTTLKPYNTSYVKWSDNTTGNKIIKWTIKPQTVANVGLETTSFPYDNINKTVNLPESFRNKFTITEGTTSARNVGTYSVYVKPKTNYAWSDGKTDTRPFTWTISTSDKYRYDIPSFKSTNLMYNDGTAITVTEASHWNNYMESQLSLGGVVTAKSASVYTAKFAIRNQNCTWTDGSKTVKSVTWTINPKTVKIPNFIGANHNTKFNPTVTHNVTTFIRNYDSNYVSLGGTTTVKEATVANATAILKDKSNYCWTDKTTANKTISWSIHPATINIPVKPNNVSIPIYNNGNEYSVTSVLNPDPDSNYVSMGGTYKATNAIYDGNTYDNTPVMPMLPYTAIFALKNTVSTVWEDGTKTNKTVDWSIKPKTIDPPTLAVNSKVYAATASNKVQSVALSAASTVKHSLQSDNTLKVGSNTYKKIGDEVGEYTVLAYRKNINEVYKNNYVNCPITWTITPFPVTRPSITSDIRRAVFNPKLPTDVTTYLTPTTVKPYITVANAVSDTNTVQYTMVASLKDKKNYKWDNNSPNDVKIGWQINKATVQAPDSGANEKTLPWDGTVKHVTMITALGYNSLTAPYYADMYIDIYDPTIKNACVSLPSDYGDEYHTSTFSLKYPNCSIWDNGKNTADISIKWGVRPSLLPEGDPTLASNSFIFDATYFGTGNNIVVETKKVHTVSLKSGVAFNNACSIKPTNTIEGSKVSASTAGTYTVRVYTKNYPNVLFSNSMEYKNVRWTINPKTVTPTLVTRSFVYKAGTNQSVELNAESNNFAKINTSAGYHYRNPAGTYTVYLSPRGVNYVLSIDSFTWTIKPATVTPGLVTSSFPYTGDSKKVSLNSASSIGASLTGTTLATDVGTYYATPKPKVNYALSSNASLKWTIYQEDLPSVKVGGITYTADKFIEDTPSIIEGVDKRYTRDTFVWYVKLVPSNKVDYSINCSGNCFGFIKNGSELKSLTGNTAFDPNYKYAVAYRREYGVTTYGTNWTITGTAKNVGYKNISKKYSMDTTKGLTNPDNRKYILNSLSWHSIMQYIRNNQDPNKESNATNMFQVGDKKEIEFANRTKHTLLGNYNLYKPTKMRAVIVHKNYHPERNTVDSNKKYNLYFGLMQDPHVAGDDNPIRLFALYGANAMSLCSGNVTISGNYIVPIMQARNTNTDFSGTFIDNILFKIRDDYFPDDLNNNIYPVGLSSKSTKASDYTRRVFAPSIKEIYGRTDGRAVVDVDQFDFFKNKPQPHVFKAPIGDAPPSTASNNRITAWLRDGINAHSSDIKYAKFACMGNDSLMIGDKTIKHIFFHDGHSADVGSCNEGDNWNRISLGIIPFFAIQ